MAIEKREDRKTILSVVVFLGVTGLGSCRFIQPPITPDPAWLGCYHLSTNLPRSYQDSLGYDVPAVIQLAFTRGGQWTVLPTDMEWKPSWGTYDGLPSSRLVRQHELAMATPMQWDSVSRIPGDSIDVTFPSAIGRLVFRVGPDGDELGGRAEWVVREDQYFLNEGVWVAAVPSSCDGLAPRLRRTRYR
jgi:hypothetical protein